MPPTINHEVITLCNNRDTHSNILKGINIFWIKKGENDSLVFSMRHYVKILNMTIFLDDYDLLYTSQLARSKRIGSILKFKVVMQ
jgi:hypothetical protein